MGCLTFQINSATAFVSKGQPGTVVLPSRDTQENVKRYPTGLAGRTQKSQRSMSQNPQIKLATSTNAAFYQIQLEQFVYQRQILNQFHGREIG